MKKLAEPAYEESLPEKTIRAVPRLEWVIAVFVAILIVYLHAVFFQNAGGLWRDEASRIDLAALPSIADLWASLQFDAYPVLSPLLMRIWAGKDLLVTDFSIRVFGLLVGVSILGVLWLNTRLQRHSLPLLSMSLFGLNTWTIRTGDAVGQYGLGIFLNLLTFGLIWRVVDSPSPGRILAALVAAVLSMQCVYQSSLLIFVFCISGSAVVLYNRRWKGMAALTGIGLAAALSLLPYLKLIGKSTQWGIVIKYPNTFMITLKILWRESLGSSSRIIPWIWAGLFLLGIFIAINRIFRKKTSAASEKEKNRTIFLATAMVASTAVFFLFFNIMNIRPTPWYFLYPMSIVAVSLDGLLAGNKSVWRLGRIALTVIIVGLAFNGVFQEVRMRQTSLDIIASRLERLASKSDLILVYPWYFGVSFQRYYRGKAPWMTIPPMDDLNIHRYDLLKKKMASPRPLQTVFAGTNKTLQGGDTVWLVGDIDFYTYQVRPAQPVQPLTPDGAAGWDSRQYLWNWQIQALGLVSSRSLSHKRVFQPPVEDINPLENAGVMAVWGWRKD